MDIENDWPAFYDWAHASFTDDVEFYFDEPGTIHFRAASRVGHSDMGVNRDRIEEIRRLFTKAYPKHE